MDRQKSYESQFAESGQGTEPGRADPGGRGVNWPTVLAAAGVAAIVSSIISVIAVVGIVVSDRSDDSAAGQQPAVINLGGAVEPTAPGAVSEQSIAAEPESAGQAEAPAATGPVVGADPVAPAPSSSPTAPSNSPTATPTSTPEQAGRDGGPLPADFTVTAQDPTVQDFGNIVEFLVATNASDSAKAANLEAGMDAVVVPRTVYNLGLFRAPNGWNEVSGPLVRDGASATVSLSSGSVGRPTINVTIAFKQIGGVWKLSSSSLCRGVQAVGLNIYCNA